ncbi:MAG: vitamin K epoxide reductase [Verrucomicrobiota bacterium]|nr:vitamin K epoxide reductase [Verrucomicrobiota bacterium]
MAASNTSKEHLLEGFRAVAINTLPRGLTFNPSAWALRLPILALALAGFCVASYLMLYQLGVMKTVWEPFFGDGSRKVLHSFISRLLPVPDAALGASGYFAEFLVGIVGGSERWRTMPWMVILYGAIVASVSATAIGLALVQGLVIHAGCTLCLTSAAISIVIAGLARREVFASVALIKERRSHNH